MWVYAAGGLFQVALSSPFVKLADVVVGETCAVRTLVIRGSVQYIHSHRSPLRKPSPQPYPSPNPSPNPNPGIVVLWGGVVRLI